MKHKWTIFLASILLYCWVSLPGNHAGHSGIQRKIRINCSTIPEDVGEDQSSLYTTMYQTLGNVTLGVEGNTTSICIATYMGENTTVITKRSTSFNLSNPDLRFQLLNKSALRTHVVHLCDPECEQKFNVGRIYVREIPKEDYKYFLQYYTNYRCIDPVPPVDSTSLEHYLRMVSLFFMCLSLISCVFFVVRFVVEKNLRTLPGFCVFSLCIADLILYPCFFAMKIAPHDKNTKFVCSLYLYTTLANWFWINVLTFDLWKTIRLTIRKFRRSSAKSLILRFIYFSIYAWGVPLIITILIVCPFTSDQRLIYHGGFSNESKYLAELYIAVPLLAVQLSNFGLFYSSVYMIFKESKFKSQPVRSEVSNIKRNFMFFFRLSFVQAIIWLFGMIGYFAKIEIFMYTYIYAKILEGPYIVWSFAVTGRSMGSCVTCSGSCTSTTVSEETSS